MSSGKRAFNWPKSKRWWKEVDDDSDVSLMALLHCNFSCFSSQELSSSDPPISSFGVSRCFAVTWLASESPPEEQLPTPIGQECSVYANGRGPCSAGGRNERDHNCYQSILLINPFQIVEINCHCHCYCYCFCYYFYYYLNFSIFSGVHFCGVSFAFFIIVKLCAMIAIARCYLYHYSHRQRADNTHWSGHYYNWLFVFNWQAPASHRMTLRPQPPPKLPPLADLVDPCTFLVRRRPAFDQYPRLYSGRHINFSVATLTPS